MSHMKNLSNCIYIDTNRVLKNIASKDIQYTIPIFIPHLGCKNECIFCNQRKISGKSSDVKVEDVEKEIKERLGSFKQKRKIQIAFFGGSFTGLNIEDQIMYLKLANNYIKSGKVDSIRISTRPDYINVKILKVLKKYNVKTIELGVQSMDEEVLYTAKRGHTSIDVIRSAKLISLFGFELGFQIMIGLPKSTEEKERETIKKLLKYNPKQLRIYPVYVLEQSKLYDMYKTKEYIPLTLEEAYIRSAKVIDECKNSDVQIIRIGLQSTAEITQNVTEVKGPVSDNFGEYALSEIVLFEIERKLKDINLIGSENINIVCDKKYQSIVIGPKKKNKIYLESKYKRKVNIIGE